MRTHLLLLGLATSLAASAVASSSNADACGVYMLSPRVFWLAHSGKKAFVVEGLDQTNVAIENFTQVNPMTYDATATFEQPKRAVPFEVALVNTRGATATVKADHEVLLRYAQVTHHKQARALEIDDPGFRGETIAVAGKHTGLQLLPIAWPTNERAQITATITADVKYDEQIHDYRTTLHDTSGAVVGLMVGKPHAVLAADGQQHLIVDNDGVANAYLIDAGT